jgi:hypothetical protein
MPLFTSLVFMFLGLWFLATIPAVGSLPHSYAVMHDLPWLTGSELYLLLLFLHCFIELCIRLWSCCIEAYWNVITLCFHCPSRWYGLVDSTALYLWGIQLASVLDNKLSWLVNCSFLHFCHAYSRMVPFSGPQGLCVDWNSISFFSKIFIIICSLVGVCDASHVDSKSEDDKSVYHVHPSLPI